MSGVGEDFWKRVVATAQVLATRTYYQVLGVAPGASGAEVRDSYYRLVRMLHPDRYARERDPERKRALVLIYARVGEAYQMLSSPTLRQRYDEGLASGNSRLQPEQLRAQERPAARDPKAKHVRVMYERGRELLEAGEVRSARAQLQMAMGFEPDSRAIQEALAELARRERLPLPPPVDEAAPAAPAPAPRPPRRAPTAEDLPSDFARQHTRHPVVREIKVRCADWAQVETFYTRNISKGGMLIRTNDAPPLGTRLELVVTVPDGREVTLAAEVVRVIPPAKEEPRAGMGVRFVDIDEEVLTAVEEMIRRERSAPREQLAEDPAAGEVHEELSQTLARIRGAAAGEVLGVPAGAEPAAVRRAYLELARRYHPDIYRRYESVDVVEAASEIAYLVRRAYEALRKAAVPAREGA